MFIIGIDPGVSGGIAMINTANRKLIVRKMPPTATEILEHLQFYLTASKGDIFVFLEKVQGLPKMSGSGMFTFGENSGYIKMALLSLKIPFETVTPQKWMKEMQLGTKSGMSQSAWKNKLKNRAEQLYPQNKFFLWGSDAALIAEYGRRNI